MATGELIQLGRKQIASTWSTAKLEEKGIRPLGGSELQWIENW
jgi:hypothetical protein